MRASLVAFAAGLLLAAGCRSAPRRAAAATPQRPTLSSDTNTAAPGTLEVEGGLDADLGDPAGSTPFSLRFGSGPRTELFANVTPLLWVETPTGREAGIGDLGLGLRHRILEETPERPSMAVQSTVLLPTADSDQGLGSGELGVAFAAIASKAFGRAGGTAYYELGLLGETAGGTDTAHSLALAGSAPLADRLGAFAEIAAQALPDGTPLFATLGLTWAPEDALVLDVALRLGLNDDAAGTQLLVGFTRNMGPIVDGAGRPPAGAPQR